MNNRELMGKIKNAITARPDDIGAYNDYFSALRLVGGEEGRRGVFKENEWLRAEASRQVPVWQKKDPNTAISFYELVKRTYLYAAKDDFHSYMIYLEWNRKARDKFYQPRMKVLRPLVKAIQKLADDELDELFLSMPPRVGKTTMLMFLCTWLVGRNSEASNLYSAFSDTITLAFYNGCLEVMQDPQTYLWGDVFHGSSLAETNAKTETFNVDRKKRYPSLTCRSLYGTLNGACDCNGFLISDDLIGGIEEALNKERMMSAWSKVDNNLLPRAKEGAKILWCGTRWSIVDPAGLRMDLLRNDPNFKDRRVEIINLPALNAKEESNFNYDFGVGFSTDYFKMRRASFEHNNDIASWDAQYMGEPVERSGVLFEPSEMKYYNGMLPDKAHLLKVVIAVDPAFGGGDFTSAPVGYVYDDGSVYVHDVVFNSGDKKITQPLLADLIERNNPSMVRFEVNRSTSSYKEGVEEILRNRGLKVNIVTGFVDTHGKTKEYRIYEKSPEIREFYFLETQARSKEYAQFMSNVFSYQISQANNHKKHDDSVDSLAQLADMVQTSRPNLSVGRRPF